MMTDEMDIELPASRMQLPTEQARFQTLEPHRTIALDGVLCSGQAFPRRHDEIAHIALSSLISLVRQVTNWTDTSGTENNGWAITGFWCSILRRPPGSKPMCRSGRSRSAT